MQMDIMAKTVQVCVHQIVRRVAILTGSVAALPAGTDSTVVPVLLFSYKDISKISYIKMTTRDTVDFEIRVKIFFLYFPYNCYGICNCKIYWI